MSSDGKTFTSSIYNGAVYVQDTFIDPSMNIIDECLNVGFNLSIDGGSEGESAGNGGNQYSETIINNTLLTQAIPTVSDPSFNWCISSSYNQKVIVLSMYDNYIYISNDYGTSWTLSNADVGVGISQKWTSNSISKNGRIIAATRFEGNIAISIDNVWTTTASARKWNNIKLSEDGTNMVASTYDSYIYVSYDTGSTWIQCNTPQNLWTQVSLSYSGTTVAAVASNGYIYISKDSGNLWINSDGERDWASICMSYSGLYMCAVVRNGYIYVSNNYGVDWTARKTDQVRNWSDVAMSSNGSIIVAFEYGGRN
jgi:hypothetical protein